MLEEPTNGLAGRTDDDNQLDDKSTPELITGILGDARHLISAELEALKLEVKDELARAKTVLVMAAAGGAVLALGVLMVVFMGVYALGELTAIPMWGSFGIAGGVLLLAGGVMLLVGKQQANEQADLWPEESIADLKRDASSIKDAVRSGTDDTHATDDARAADDARPTMR